MKDIISFINKADQNELISSIRKDKKISMKINDNNIDLSEDDILIEEIAKDNLCANGNNEFTVALDVRISKELKLEGILRDLIRHVQNFRKDSGLEVNDRIIFAKSGSEQVLESINKFKQ